MTEIDETINRLFEAMLRAVDDEMEHHRFTRGEAMSAMVHLLVHTGLCEEGDTVAIFEGELYPAIKGAISEHQRRRGIQ